MASYPQDARPHLKVVAGVLEQDGKYLITQRRLGAVFPSCWEFPGGKVESGEAEEAALIREIQHRLGVVVDVGSCLSRVVHPYAKYSVELALFECTLLKNQIPKSVHVADFKWVSSAEFEQYTFTPADEVSMNKLLGLSESP